MTPEQAVKEEFRKYLHSKVPNIQNKIQTELPKIFRNTDIYKELLEGILNERFRLGKTAQDQVEQVVSKFSQSVSIQYKNDGFVINIGFDDFQDLLETGKDLQEESYLDKDNSQWLESLLIKGDTFEKQGSTIFRVPPEFAGTIDNNWFFRTISENIKLIEDIIKYEVGGV